MKKNRTKLGLTFGLLGGGFLATMTALLLSACGGPKSSIGFSLPDGDVTRGRDAFVRLDCTNCHTVLGENLKPGPDVKVNVPLGGEVLRAKTYGQLVTSVINPQHVVDPKYKVSQRNGEVGIVMTDHNDVMTVQEMIDIVAFLQAHYKLAPPEPAYYGFGPP